MPAEVFAARSSFRVTTRDINTVLGPRTGQDNAPRTATRRRTGERGRMFSLIALTGLTALALGLAGCGPGESVPTGGNSSTSDTENIGTHWRECKNRAIEVYDEYVAKYKAEHPNEPVVVPLQDTPYYEVEAACQQEYFDEHPELK